MKKACISKSTREMNGLTHHQLNSSMGPLTHINFNELDAESIKAEYATQANIAVLTSNGHLCTMTHIGINTDLDQYLAALNKVMGDKKHKVNIVWNSHIDAFIQLHETLIELLKKNNYEIFMEEDIKTKESRSYVVLYPHKVVLTQLVDSNKEDSKKPVNKNLRRVSSSDLYKPMPSKNLEEEVTELPFPFKHTSRRATSLPSETNGVTRTPSAPTLTNNNNNN